jgi:hypothetical protein
VIPLANKIKDLQNHRAWEKRGRDVVNEMKELVVSSRLKLDGQKSSLPVGNE